ncbi:MAG: glycine--tRNA ligase [Candidatus Cloacimonetes bacterium]|nr:glycine--tRNA ligase [Candidatus Cloacimonadota bacterium]
MAVDMKELTALCKRRGFIFQSSEIYGGINGFWDYGPYGVELKNAIKQFWWREIVHTRPDVVGQDASIIMHPTVWKASGHEDGFTDPMVDCRDCKSRFRADQLEEPGKCGSCGSRNMTEVRKFNLMLSTSVGANAESSTTAYLRPETAQAIFVNFKTIQKTSRKKLPFGIAQIGKAFRNEITPRNFTFRSREFEQMEMQYFIDPEDKVDHFSNWAELRKGFFTKLGFPLEKLRFKDHGQELAHYAKRAMDIEFEFPFGWQEVEGIHDRGDFDLTQHAQFAGENMEYFDEDSKRKFVPHVVETSIGADRVTLAVLCEAYSVENLGTEAEPDLRTVLRFKAHIAPVQVAVLPLMKKLSEPAEALERELNAQGFRTEFDVTGQIGKRYRRYDEIGTPYCVTFDFESLEDQAVTVRFRDSMEQVRIPISGLSEWLRKEIHQSMLPSL